ncbi:hypothetical protein PF005_g31504 [Phytophthora fragariae]|uniref:Uncharacterized protein n=1 Tax=Phytophthora fragariae TaxID=53985 RepID=A0A6A3GIX0_9STRA|nr:hypothetical protein PF003_g28054 [Phytophthora fragariae]KAE8887914.1 hypothetical protein PF003_g28045 [Phytophthora fragariae]KAE8918114.1 hypothetical protein PF009_g31569 [Phytophthora fragariae]KAE8958415.1 hypothetical protein PF011_g30772 [Phytophthora fragariae]KAE9058026.1 hypothetical protein PF010_g31150 [Phytophthora fragariae]
MGAARVRASACCLIQGVSATTSIRLPCLPTKDSEPACCSPSPPRGPVAGDASQACASARCAVQDDSSPSLTKWQGLCT